jgi:hypothetical protein
MDLKRLFHVLVVGGSMLATKGCAKEPGDGNDNADGALSDRSASPLPDSGADVPPADSGVAAPRNEAADVGITTTDSGADAPWDGAPDAGVTATDVAADADQTKGTPCFCGSQPACCTTHGDAMSSPAAGVYCCWGTRCP